MVTILTVPLDTAYTDHPTRPESVRDRVLFHATAHPAWGYRRIWVVVGYEGHIVSEARVLRLLRDEGLILPARYQREGRKLPERCEGPCSPRS